jgi:hypothetical protein
LTTNLLLFHVFNGEIEPYSKTGIARVRSNEQVVLKVGDVVDAAEVAALEASVEYEMTFFGPARVAGRHYCYFVDVSG